MPLGLDRRELHLLHVADLVAGLVAEQDDREDSGQTEADQEVARVLTQLYDNNPQAYYNAIQESISYFIQHGGGNGLAYEIDVLNSLQSYATANGIEIDTSNGMTLEQAHAAYAQLQG